MKILLTGASGFLGSVMKKHFQSLRADVITLGRNANNDIQKDLNEVSALPLVDVVVHAAGKAHIVPKTKAEADDFFTVNLEGTKKLCAALETNLPKAFVFISTVAVYGVDEGTMIDEAHALNGTTPYAKSKIEAEQFLQNWCAAKQVKLSIFRLPLIAGPKAPGNLGAMINGIQSGKYFRIGNGDAKKSIVMASDVAAIIPHAVDIGGVYNLTDGYHPSFKELEENFAQQLGGKSIKTIPLFIATMAGWVGDVFAFFPINSNKRKKITATLTFADQKAKDNLNWQPNKVLDKYKIEINE
jgi:GlcNAc-P-P-Und epimerase